MILVSERKRVMSAQSGFGSQPSPPLTLNLGRADFHTCSAQLKQHENER
jgi:hypothetical protein